MLYELPTRPLCRKVAVTTAEATVDEIGRSRLALMAASMAAAMVFAESPFVTPTVTRTPPQYSAIVPLAVAGPVTVMVPLAATPAPLSSRTPIHSSVIEFDANQATACR